jgi:hypothetical protein
MLLEIIHKFDNYILIKHLWDWEPISFTCKVGGLHTHGQGVKLDKARIQGVLYITREPTSCLGQVFIFKLGSFSL